jgi:hypothetical protein
LIRHIIHKPLLWLSIFAVILMSFSSPASAFYERQGDEGYVELRGMIRGMGYCRRYPDSGMFFKDRSECDIAGIIRLMMMARIRDTLTVEVNAYQTYFSDNTVLDSFTLGVPLDVERSSDLEWSFSDRRYVHMALDRLNLRWSKDRLDLILGRQPINLATTFYFSPNDFFAPFAAQAFYRVYKPGVDAIRAEVRLGDLSQLSLINVLGYDQEPDSDTGWSNDPSGNRSSYIGRVCTVFSDFEWSLIAGLVCDSEVIGGSLQGELFRWLGVRAEGNLSNPDDPLQETATEISVGLEHHWENSLDVRLEYFYNGSGLVDYYQYAALGVVPKAEKIAYPGRNYTALGVGYEFSPLLNGQMALISNLEDSSSLCSFNVVYSLSNESELVVNLGIPLGKEPERYRIRSEFGLLPWSINAELRYYF